MIRCTWPTMIERGVTAVHFVPSMLAVFVAEPLVRRSKPFATCSLPVRRCRLERRHLREVSRAGLHNLYGPTEAAVDVTFTKPATRRCRCRSVRRVQHRALRARRALRPVPSVWPVSSILPVRSWHVGTWRDRI